MPPITAQCRWLLFYLLVVILVFALFSYLMPSTAQGAMLSTSDNPADLTARERVDSQQVMISFEDGKGDKYCGVNFYSAYSLLYDFQGRTGYFCPRTGVDQQFEQAITSPRSDWGLLALKFNLLHHQAKWELKPNLVIDCGPQWLALCSSLPLNRLENTQFGLRAEMFSFSGFLRIDNLFKESAATYAVGLNYYGPLKIKIETAYEFKPEEMAYLRVGFNGLPEIDGARVCPGLRLNIIGKEINWGFELYVFILNSNTDAKSVGPDSAW